MVFLKARLKNTKDKEIGDIFKEVSRFEYDYTNASHVQTVR